MLAQQESLMKIAKGNQLLADSIHNANTAHNLTELQIDSYVLALPRTQPKQGYTHIGQDHTEF